LFLFLIFILQDVKSDLVRRSVELGNAAGELSAAKKLVGENINKARDTALKIERDAGAPLGSVQQVRL
jgi:hypothetical protein